MQTHDTIAALSSAVGPAARMILRLAGPQAFDLLRHFAPGSPTTPGASRTRVVFSDLDVPAWVYRFRAPRSYTGDDLVELHLPGNPLLARLLLDAIVRAGARHAEPGEFTARAFFNGRLDLTQAEGVSAAVSAASAGQAAAARRLMSGELAERLRPATDLVAETLALVEVGIDFSEEDVTFLSAGEVGDRIARTDRILRDLLDGSLRFERLAHEPRLVLVGRPNAGKSTLLNALAGTARAVVSPVAGTTRDALAAEVTLPRGRVQLIDVAGLETELPRNTDGRGAQGLIDEQMRRRAWRELESADAVVLVSDASDDRPPLDLPRRPDLVVYTKSDLLRATARDDALVVSAVSGAGMDELRVALDGVAFGDPSQGAALALNARHVAAIGDARAALAAASRAVSGSAPELVAADLREALDALGSVLGAVTPDDILGRIFSSFCIGK